MKRRCLTLIFFVLLLPLVDAGIGVSPPKATYEYTHQDTITHTIRVSNTENTPLQLSFTLEGELLQYLDETPEDVTLQPQESREVQFNFNLPENLPFTGPQAATIRIHAKPLTSPASGGFSATISIETQLILNIPYPGKYLSYEYEIPIINQEEQPTFLFSIQNKGNETIDLIKIFLTFYTLQSKREGSLYEELHSFHSQEQRTVTITSPDLNLPPGRHIASAYLTYDGASSIEMNRTFGIGHLYVEVINYTQHMITGEVQPFNITVLSNWNSPLTNVHASLSILDQYENTLRSALTLPATLNPWTEHTLSGYINLKDIPKGTHPARVTVSYEDASTTQDGELFLTLMPSERKEELLLVIIVLFIILSNILWIYYMKKNKKAPSPQGRGDLINKL